MPHYEMPPEVSAEEQRAVIAALERVMGADRGRSSPWTVAGRAEALRVGALQARRMIDRPWGFRGAVPFARGGVPPLIGRGDAT
jgi:hypothetical protein